ncbi:MAG: alpha-glucan family phosphorylase [Candidatus Elarobacter sp.]
MREPLVAYVSMEIAVASDVATYGGGLGVLAGDVVRAAADAAYPMVAVSLLYREGYFRQRIDAAGMQHEEPQRWRVDERLEPLPTTVALTISGRTVVVGVWRYDVMGVDGVVPVFFLDTDREENDEAARALSQRLYGGDPRYRLEQETLLGLGTVAMLRALNYRVGTYHMNEGHSALLVLALANDEELDRVRERCVFTTHTPVPAGHDAFSMDLAHDVLGAERVAALRALELVHDDTLNMTFLALRGARHANAVAMRHGEVARAMFPGFDIDAITNGVHAATWTCGPVQALFDRYVPAWRRDNFALRHAAGIPLRELLDAHAAAKYQLIERVAQAAGGVRLDPHRFTIGCARRATAYKRVDLILRDHARLSAIARAFGGIQIVFAGKAHPNDWDGKNQIRHIHELANALRGAVEVVFVEGYDMAWGAALTAGADLWLNTPRPPLEASGTSGMKAALNGVPSLSVVDGWWVEGAIEGVTGWSIDASTGDDDARAADELYRRLEHDILPRYVHERDAYAAVMRNAIALNGSHFNAQRMLAQYAIDAYASPLSASERVAAGELLAG